ncbi:MAG: hypothetical protein QOI71_518 [Gaiellales bacterium]|jgi:hypothetical protein|nr:hypothetical protein [Gaiellales bacterium]
MRRPDVSAIALAAAAGVLGVLAHTGPLYPGLASLVVAGHLLRARSAQYILVWAVAPLLIWATYADVAALAGALALAGAALAALLNARERRPDADEVISAARITLAAAMVLIASGFLSFDLLLR